MPIQGVLRLTEIPKPARNHAVKSSMLGTPAILAKEEL